MSRPGSFNNFFGRNSKPKNACPDCSDRFFTQVGLDEHVRLGVHDTQGFAVRRVAQAPAPAPAPAQSWARGMAARNNARRFRCGECPLVSTPSGVAIHQKSTGHVGSTELALT